jgi:hypothetical protein
MADIRIKDLTTTASTTAADDFFAADGATNGTRKLSAYSPSFGGNATVGGTLTVNGAGTSSFAGNVQIPNATNYVVRNAANTSTAMRMYADSSDYGYVDATANTELRLQVGAGTKLSIGSTGIVTIPGTTASTSASSGALVVGNGTSGGLGVGGAIYAGGYLSTGNHARIGAQSSVVAFSANNNVDGGLPAAWTGNYGVGVQYLGSSSNAFFIGDGSGGSTYFYTRTGSANTARLTIDNTNGNLTASGDTSTFGTNSSSSNSIKIITGVGSLATPKYGLLDFRNYNDLKSGAYIRVANRETDTNAFLMNVAVRSNADVLTSIATFSDTQLAVLSTTASTSTSSGALVVSGGVGVAKSLNVGEAVTVAGGSFAAASFYKSASLGTVLSGATGSSYDLYITNPAGNHVMQVPTGTRNAEFAATLTTVGAITSGASISTSAPTGGSGAWELGVYSTTAPSATGYVTIEIGGVAYKLLASNV